MLYAASADQVFAFPAEGCGVGSATCEPLASLPTPGAWQLVVASGQLYVTGRDEVMAFGLA